MPNIVITTSPLVKTYTLQEFWTLPEPPDHSKLELIKGVLYMTPSPDYPHNDASANLIRRLIEEVKRCNYSGRVFVPRAAIWVNDNTYLEPDLMYLSEELQAAMNPRHWTRADVVIEVISPSNALYDRRTKSDTYRAMGVRELWLVDPVTREVEVRCFESGASAVYKAGQLIGSEVLATIAIAVEELFS